MIRKIKSAWEIYRKSWCLYRATHSSYLRGRKLKFTRLTFRERILEGWQLVRGHRVMFDEQQQSMMRQIMILRIMHLSCEGHVEPIETTLAYVECKRGLAVRASGLCERWIMSRSIAQLVGWSIPIYAVMFGPAAFDSSRDTILTFLALGFPPLWMLLVEQSRLLFCRAFFLHSILAIEDDLQDAQQILNLNLELTQGRSLYQLANLLIPMSWGFVAFYFLGVPVLLLPTAALSRFLTEAGLVLALLVNWLAVLGLGLWVDSRYIQPFWLAVQAVTYRDWRSQHWREGSRFTNPL